MLGPVELVVDGRQVSVRSARARRVLAMLALHRDRVVSIDRIADAVWGESLPTDASAALHSQISRLRSALGPSAAAVETASGGYRLRRDLVAVDIDRFDSLVASASDEDDPRAQAVVLTEAIAMVRGHAFEDLDVDDASIEARRVDEVVAVARVRVGALVLDEATQRVRPGRRVPHSLVSVVGRERELDAVVTLLASTRIVTLIGPGGVGKTTLALAAVARRCAASRLENAFVDLAPVAASDAVPAAFARALGVERPGDEHWPDRLAEALGPTPMLVLVDNAEHVVEAVATLVADLVGATNITILATSRTPLGIPGEALAAIGPLETQAAVDLFHQRGRDADPSWAPSPDGDQQVSDICARLDGQPLAIELAAAQLRWRTPGEILDALDRPLDALRRDRALTPRHSSLRAVIADSHRLLDPTQQLFLDEICVFASGFTATTAAQVRSTPAAIADNTSTELGALVEHSLLRAESRSTGTRYTLLDTVRHYGIERLTHRGELLATRARHAQAMLELTETASRSLWGPDEPKWVEQIDDERADICAAHQTLLEGGDTDTALRLATAAYLVAWPRGWSDLRELINAIDPLATTAPDETLAPALSVAADFANFAGDSERARQLAQRAVAVGGDRPELTCFASAVLGDISLFAGDVSGAVANWEAAGRGFSITVPGLAPYAAAGAALTLAYGDRTDDSLERATAALHAADRSGCPTSQAFARYAAAEACTHSDPSRATDLLTEAITISATVSGAFIANLARLTLATLTASQGQPYDALAFYPTLLREWRRAGQWAQQWNTLRTLVPILTEAGAYTDAALLLGGLRAHAQADTWGRDQLALARANAELHRQLTGDYPTLLQNGAATEAVDLVTFAEQVADGLVHDDRRTPRTN